MTVQATQSTQATMATMLDRFTASLGLSVPADPWAGIATRWDALLTAGVGEPGAAFAAWLDLGAIGGVLPPLLANSADVGSMLETLARFHPLWGDDAVVVERRPGGTIVVGLRAPDGAGLHPQTVEAFAGVLSRMLARLADLPVVPDRLTDRRISTDGLRPVLQLDQASASARLVSADPGIASVLTGFAESAIDGLAGSWERRIRDEIRGHPRRSPTLRDVSSRLAMSDRTLQLRLQEAGTTFSAIVDDERRLFVEALLLVPTFAVADVARRAGFSTTEGLSRAMVRWTGRSPVAWRRERS